MASTNTSVLIVGAGPVGLLTALRLGQAGINTTVIEAHETILPTTRAMVYMPVVIPVLKKLGLMHRVAQEGYLNRDGIMWRDLDGNPLAHIWGCLAARPIQDGYSYPRRVEEVLLC